LHNRIREERRRRVSALLATIAVVAAFAAPTASAATLSFSSVEARASEVVVTTATLSGAVGVRGLQFDVSIPPEQADVAMVEAVTGAPNWTVAWNRLGDGVTRVVAFGDDATTPEIAFDVYLNCRGSGEAILSANGPLASTADGPVQVVNVVPGTLELGPSASPVVEISAVPHPLVDGRFGILLVVSGSTTQAPSLELDETPVVLTPVGAGQRVWRADVFVDAGVSRLVGRAENLQGVSTTLAAIQGGGR